MLTAAALCTAGAHAQGMPPWTASALPISAEVKSVEVVRKDEPLYTAPTVKSPRRGAVALGARLPLFGAQRGDGCRGDFYLVGPSAWLCSEGGRPSGDPPVGAGFTAASGAAGDDGLPRTYYFVNADGAFGYRDLAEAEQTAPAAELQPGFAVAVTRVATGPRGEPYGLTTKQLWLPLRDLSRIQASTFHGYEAGGKLDRGWVVSDGARPRQRPAGDAPSGERRSRLDEVHLEETVTIPRAQRWVRIGSEQWLDERDVRYPILTAPPAEARPGERWIDVDLDRQVLTAYEGERPVFATLVSTGIGHEPSETATPRGVHRVWVKLASTDMTNLENEEARRYYAMQEVPWVLFFKKGYGLHGAFWHRSFGRVRSHGCVNLTPLDARRLFEWSGPHLPAGWTAVLPTDYDPGTLVRVR